MTENAAARGVRAALRRWRQRGAAAGACASRDGSILDSVLQEAELARRHAGTQRPLQAERVSGFGSRGRAAHPERREAGAAESIELPDRPVGIPESFEEHTKLMFDLQLHGVPRRPDARVQHDHGARAERPHVSDDRRSGPASPDFASPRRSGADVAEGAIDTYHVQMLTYFSRRCRPRRMATARCSITA